MDKHVDPFLPAYALGCLGETEMIEVARHLQNCARCRAELDSFHEVVDQLPMAVSLRTPPPELKSKLMRQVQSGQKQRQPTVKTGINSFKTQWLRNLTPAWTFASLVLVVILGLSNILAWNRLNRLATLSNGSLPAIQLTGTENALTASGALVISGDGEYGTLVVDGLPVLDSKHQYQLWLIKEGERTSGGIFSVGEDGYGALQVSSPVSLSNYDAIGITIEPFGGSPGPTGDKVLGGTL